MIRSSAIWLFLVFGFVNICVVGPLGAQDKPGTSTTPGSKGKPVVLWVSPKGDDHHDGSSEHPLATLFGARDRIRAMREAKSLAPDASGISVMVTPGTYEFATVLELNAQDTGTAECPIVYRAQPGVILTGSRAISNFTTYKGSILQADVRSIISKEPVFNQLFFDGRRQILARYPNADPVNPWSGGWAYVDGVTPAMYTDIPGESRQTLVMKQTDVHAWAHPEEGQVFVFARYNWWNNILAIEKFDAATRTISTTEGASYAMRPGDRYFVQGLFEELDSPGEWYLDRKAGKLYFWAPSAMEGKPAYAPVTRTILRLNEGVSHVSFRGFTIEGCEGNAVELYRTQDCLIEGNTIRNVGDYNGDAVVITDGRRNGVVGNDIFQIGRSGITMGGGDRVTLTPAENYADNNYIHHFGVYYKQGVGVEVNGVGNRVTHNLIHDGPRFGILFSGNNLLIEKNHVRHVDLETEDTGAIYTGGRDWISSRGTIIRYNYFHDILGFGRDNNGHWVSPYFAWGIYLDDNTGGVDVIGNIVVHATRAGIHLHNGRDNNIENNVFIDNGPRQFELNGWFASDRMWKDFFPGMVAGYASVAKQPAWKNMRNISISPEQSILPNGMTMLGDEFHRNIFYWTNPDAALGQTGHVPLDHLVSDQNLIWHGGQAIFFFKDWNEQVRESWEKWQALGLDKKSVIADPKFVDVKAGDYRLSADSPAWALGFKKIPVDEIGPYKAESRASWPIVEAPGVREWMVERAKKGKDK